MKTGINIVRFVFPIPKQITQRSKYSSGILYYLREQFDLISFPLKLILYKKNLCEFWEKNTKKQYYKFSIRQVYMKIRLL